MGKTLAAVVRTAAGVRQFISAAFDGAEAEGTCQPIAFSVASQWVDLKGDCELDVRMLSKAAQKPIWYSYALQTLGLGPDISNGIVYRANADSFSVGDVDCEISIDSGEHHLPLGIGKLWAVATDADGTRLWEGLLSEPDVLAGEECVLSLRALGGVPGCTSDGDLVFLLPQTEMQGMLALVCAAIAAIYLIGSASFYESGRTVAEVHGGRPSTKLFLVDGPLTAVAAVVSALMIGDPLQQAPWVVWQRTALCISTVVLFCLSAYLLYWDTNADVRSSTLRTAIELPLLTALYSPLASSSSGAVDLAALLLGAGTVLISMRAPPVPLLADPYDAVAKAMGIVVQAPALFFGVITRENADGLSHALAGLSISLGLCAAAMHVSPSYQRNTEPPLQ